MNLFVIQAVTAVCLLVNAVVVDGYFIVVDAHSEECFHDRVVKGTKMGLTFEVAEGGFLDIDVKVCSPQENKRGGRIWFRSRRHDVHI